MIDAKFVAAQLNGIKIRGGYLCECPVREHKTKRTFQVKDRSDGQGISIKCFAGCDWQYELLPEMRSRGLWPQSITPAQKAEFKRKKQAEEAEAAKLWMLMNDITSMTSADWRRFRDVRKKYNL